MVIDISWFHPGKIKGTIELKEPLRKVGRCKDIHGITWHVERFMFDDYGTVAVVILSKHEHGLYRIAVKR